MYVGKVSALQERGSGKLMVVKFDPVIKRRVFGKNVGISYIGVPWKKYASRYPEWAENNPEDASIVGRNIEIPESTIEHMARLHYKRSFGDEEMSLTEADDDEDPDEQIKKILGL